MTSIVSFSWFEILSFREYFINIFVGILLFAAKGDNIQMNRNERRRKKIKQLIDQLGGQREFAQIVDSTENYVSQILSSKGVSNRFCEKVEKGFNLPDGWLDQWVSIDPRAPIGEKLNAAEAALLKDYRSLPVHIQSAVRQIVKNYKK